MKTITEEIATLKYDEVLKLPRFKASLDKLLNRSEYGLILSIHSIMAEDLHSFVEKAINEGNAVLIERDRNGYVVTLWKD